MFSSRVPNIIIIPTLFYVKIGDRLMMPMILWQQNQKKPEIFSKNEIIGEVNTVGAKLFVNWPDLFQQSKWFLACCLFVA